MSSTTFISCGGSHYTDKQHDMLLHLTMFCWQNALHDEIGRIAVNLFAIDQGNVEIAWLNGFMELLLSCPCSETCFVAIFQALLAEQ